MSFKKIKLNSQWKQFLGVEETDKVLNPIYEKVRQELESNYIVYPKLDEIFRAFSLTAIHQLKVVILGQDPYHGENQAHGLSFSVQSEVKLPPSLKNIFKEYCNDLELPLPNHGDLSTWAEQGVLLLNSTLTVRKAEPNSHKEMGWQKFTDLVISTISEKKEGVVFILWGKFAEKKVAFIDSNRHHIIISSHPSPFSARKGFFGSKPFSKTNEILKKAGSSEINWEIK